jgi:hypothetical protein
LTDSGDDGVARLAFAEPVPLQQHDASTAAVASDGTYDALVATSEPRFAQFSKEERKMRLRRKIVTASVLTAALSAVPLLLPTSASGQSCITTVAGDVCLAQCIGAQQLACGSDPACHQSIAAVLKMLANARAGSADCSTVVAMVRQACDCPASPSGAFLDAPS